MVLLRDVASLPGVAEAVERAREACDRLRWHQGLRSGADAARAEATVRAARASAALDGAELPLETVRDVLRGVREAPSDAVGASVGGALRATLEAARVGALARRTPLQALALLHTAAAASLVPADALGRPRGDAAPRDLAGLGPAPTGADLIERLRSLAALLAVDADVPALVVASVVQGEVLAVRPFLAANGVVARALFRAVVIERGLDATGVAVHEAGWASPAAYAAAAARHASGTPDGAAAWVRHCAEAVVLGAREGERVADAVLAGRLA